MIARTSGVAPSCSDGCSSFVITGPNLRKRYAAGDIEITAFLAGPALTRAEVFPNVVVPVVPLDILLAMKRTAARPKDIEDIRILRELHPDTKDVS